jgi:hypothetical protein
MIGRSGAASNERAPIIPLLSQTPTTTRENADAPLARGYPVRFCPGMGGGTEWNGAAYRPQTDSLFVGAVDHCGPDRPTRAASSFTGCAEGCIGVDRVDVGPQPDGLAWAILPWRRVSPSQRQLVRRS